MAGVHVLHQQGHPQALAQRCAVLGKAVCRRLQTMMNMDGLHLPRPALRTGQQQRRRIRATTQAHSQRQRRGKCADCSIEGSGHGSAAG